MTKLGVAFDIVGRKRRFDEVDILAGEHLDGAKRVLPVGPGIGDIDHQRHLRANRLADIAHHSGAFAVVRNLQGIVRVRPLEADFELGGAEAELLRGKCPFAQHLAVGLQIVAFRKE